MQLYVYTLIFISGVCFGSFYNVVALRLLKKESLVYPPSHCPKCKHQLNWYELMPIFSYIFLHGKCKKCKSKISIQYPLIELLTGILFLISYYLFGFSLDFIISIIICSILVNIYITDFKEYIILDEIIIFGSISIAIIKLIAAGFSGLINALLAGLLLFCFMYIIKTLGDKIFKRESLGGGDIKLSFLIGLTTSFQLGLVVLILSSFLAFPYAIIVSGMKKHSEVPYGPFLITSLLIVFMKMDYFSELLKYLILR